MIALILANAPWALVWMSITMPGQWTSIGFSTRLIRSSSGDPMLPNIV